MRCCYNSHGLQAIRRDHRRILMPRRRQPLPKKTRRQFAPGDRPARYAGRRAGSDVGADWTKEGGPAAELRWLEELVRGLERQLDRKPMENRYPQGGSRAGEVQPAGDPLHREPTGGTELDCPSEIFRGSMSAGMPGQRRFMSRMTPGRFPTLQYPSWRSDGLEFTPACAHSRTISLTPPQSAPARCF